MTERDAAGGAADVDWWALLTDPAFIADPYPELVRLQQAGPIHQDLRSGVFFVLGHQAFGRVVRASEMGRNTRLWTNGWNRPGAAERDPVAHRLYTLCSPQMINADPPDHGRMRGVYEPSFRPAQVAALCPMVEAEARRLLDAMPREGVVEMVGSYAGPLPLRVLGTLFGIPPEMDEQVADWSRTLMRALDIVMTPDHKREALKALEQFKAFLRGFIDRLRSCPHAVRGPMVDVLAAEADGMLDEDETLTNLASMLIAGHETTVTLIGNGLLLLLERPAELAKLRKDRGLMRGAVEEFMRVSPGTKMLLRVARAPFEVEGVAIPAGALVIGLLDAVNRDPARFERPDACDIGRRPNPHYTFGGGVHFCVGAPLARLEARIAFDALLDRYPALTLDGTARWRPGGVSTRGLGSLPVRVGS